MSIPPNSSPPSDPWTDPSWWSILVGFAIVPFVVVILWAASHPLAAGVALGSLTVTAFLGHRSMTLVRCLRDCGGFSVDIAGVVRISVKAPSATCAC